MTEALKFTEIKLQADIQWLDRRFEWSSGDLAYKGLHLNRGASESDPGWYIWKYTWSNGNPIRIEGPIMGEWNNRASLSW